MGPFFVRAVHNIAMQDADARRIAWSQYWSAGGLHSCPGSFAGNYAGAIADFWQTALADLTPGTRVLDLATGNGALPQLLLQRYGDEVQVDAVDAAQLAPTWFDPSRHPGVRFHSGVMIEALSFEDASFDCVVSQYGIEYAMRPDACQQALRVLRPQGRLALVMHHTGSVLARGAGALCLVARRRRTAGRRKRIVAMAIQGEGRREPARQSSSGTVKALVQRSSGGIGFARHCQLRARSFAGGAPSGAAAIAAATIAESAVGLRRCIAGRAAAQCRVAAVRLVACGTG